MRMQEVIGLVCMAVWVAAGVWAMNWFGFPDHMHDWVWSIGAAISLLIIIVVGVAIFFAVAKETPWIWFAKGGEQD